MVYTLWTLIFENDTYESWLILLAEDSDQGLFLCPFIHSMNYVAIFITQIFYIILINIPLRPEGIKNIINHHFVP